MWSAALLAGLFAGVILFFLSHLAPFFGAGNFIRDLDEPHLLFGRTITRREAHTIGALSHILLSGISGLALGIVVSFGLLPGFSFLSVMMWGLLATLVAGGVVMPLEGHGLFGVKEDPWFPLDLLVTNLLWALCFWWVIHFFLLKFPV